MFLVTGVAGFIGRSIAAELLQRGERVRGIDNLCTGKLENLTSLNDLEFLEADLNDADAVAKVCTGVDIIFHEAALPSVPRSVKDPWSSNEANVSGTLRLLMAARAAGVKRIVYAGSSSAYGESPTLPKVETMLPAPISPYAVSKLTVEYYMQSFTRVYGLETVTLRYFNVFGTYQDPTSQYSGVLAKFTRQMLADETPTIWGSGEQSRDFTFIDNVVHANLLAARASAQAVSGRVFNIATNSRITLNQVVTILRELTDYSGPVSNGPERSGDIKHSLADIRLAEKHLGYRVQVDFREGLRRTVEWYRMSRN